MNPDEWLTTAQVAARLGVQPSRVRQLVSEGRLVPLPLSMRAYMFTVVAVETFEQAQKPQRGRPRNS